jgi:nifR3 family TIM-barrel protein
MRRLARRYGAPYALNEVVLDKLVLQGGKKLQRMLAVAADDHPVGGQLMGADPDVFAPAAAAMVDAGYDVIDINFGCPVKKVLGRCRGGFLLSQPDTALSIIRSVFDAVGGARPVTVKMRRGTDDSTQARDDFLSILDGAFEIGVAAVTVHGRTVAQRYVGPSDWSFLAEIKTHVGDRTILGSGDLFSAEACRSMIAETGVDGVSIARGCIGNPWIFRECRALLRGDPLPPPPTVAEQQLAIEGHWADMVEVYGETLAAKHMRKFGIKYSEHHPRSREVRDAFIAARRSVDIQAVLDRWYDPATDWPPVRRRESHGDLVAAGATSQAPPASDGPLKKGTGSEHRSVHGVVSGRWQGACALVPRPPNGP